MLNEAGATRIVVTCAHCFNTLRNEYPQVGGHYEVVHHTTLLAQLVADRRLVPVAPVAASVTYHDPCYLGRHNRVFAAPREVLGAVPGLTLTEMPRNREQSFCCGAGGARMWMDEDLGTRINLNRTDEALALVPDLVTAACPFCVTMLADGVAQRADGGRRASERSEVLDIAEVLLRSVRPDLDDSASHPRRRHHPHVRPVRTTMTDTATTSSAARPLRRGRARPAEPEPHARGARPTSSTPRSRPTSSSSSTTRTAAPRTSCGPCPTR